MEKTQLERGRESHTNFYRLGAGSVIVLSRIDSS